MSSEELLPRSIEDKHLLLKHEDRWEPLRPVITRLYMGKYGPNGKSTTIANVVDFMKLHYDFHASIREYRTSFRKWEVRKRTSTGEKEGIFNTLKRKRDQAGVSTSSVILRQGDMTKHVDKKQLRRYLRDSMRQRGIEKISPGVSPRSSLSSWNLPYSAYVKVLLRQENWPVSSATPTYVSVQSPAALSPGQQRTDPSPTMQVVNQKIATERAFSLLRGCPLDLLATCGDEERMTLTNYFHDFYIHSYVTAKYWGKGPLKWTPGIVSALTLGDLQSVANPATPESIVTPGSMISLTSGILPQDSKETGSTCQMPVELCFWSIHHRDLVEYTPVPESQVDEETERQYDIENPDTWAFWSSEESSNMALPVSLRNAVVEQSFTAMDPQNVPISTRMIVESLNEDPCALEIDAWKLAIMSGNLLALIQLIEATNCEAPEDLAAIYPLHLAATFLDGAKQCCMVLGSLMILLGPEYGSLHNIDDLGHSILDAFMVTILRCHTSIDPGLVDPCYCQQNRFPGEEKDICGRWDIDSPVMRGHLQSGHVRIPDTWKHPFCHTSAQALCHSIMTVFPHKRAPSLNGDSGLFRRRCGNLECGKELKSAPLHTLVLVAYYLATRGLRGETFFGIIAVLVCLIQLDIDVTQKTDLSIEEILGTTEPGICYHSPQTALHLLQSVPEASMNSWPAECILGWHCIRAILQLAESETGEESSDSSGSVTSGSTGLMVDGDTVGSGVWETESSDDDTDYEDCCHIHEIWDNLRLRRVGPRLGQIWATVQVELLTYRRIRQDDPWISQNFSMQALKDWAERRTSTFSIPLVDQGMISEHSRCGWFRAPHRLAWEGNLFPIAEDVCQEYFMNMDVYGRANFVSLSEVQEVLDGW